MCDKSATPLTLSQRIRLAIKPDEKEKHSWKGTEDFAKLIPRTPLRSGILRLMEYFPEIPLTKEAEVVLEDILYYLMDKLCRSAAQFPFTHRIDLFVENRDDQGSFPDFVAGLVDAGATRIVHHSPFPNDEFHVFLASDDDDMDGKFFVLTRTEMTSLGR